MSRAEPTAPAREPGRETNPERPGAARELLFGLLAYRNHFIGRDDLLGAFDAWGIDPSRGLARALVDRGALSPERHALLEGLVAEYLRLHGDDPERSLSALSPADALDDALARSTDPEVRADLARLRAAAGDRDGDPFRTVTWMPTEGPEPSSSPEGGRFRVLRPHARGGLGEVFVARDTELDREVALKEIQPDVADDPQYRARFAFEAQVTGGLEHPGIVPVYGLGQTADGRPYYAMRFIRGESLKEAARRFHEERRGDGRGRGRETLALRGLLGRFTDVCDAIAYAHSRGILHRDLKPANIMLGKFGETLVVDWGLAKSVTGRGPSGVAEASELPLSPRSGAGLEPTRAGAAMGTPGYMSPEQVAGGDAVDVRSDVYGLGATLYYILTGHAPFEGEDVGAIQRRILAGAVRRPRALDPRIARPLEAICLRAMALRPADRYESAEALKADVDRWLADEPVRAYPEPIPARAWRWVRRHRTAVAAAAVLLILATVGLAVHTWRLGRAEARTADQLGMTRVALRQLLLLAGEKLADMPNTEALRKELAREALDQYQKLGEEFPGDPGVRLETAQVLRVIAGIQRLTGQFTESDGTYERAIGVLSALCAEAPGEFEYRRWLVEALHDRGELYRMNGRVSRAVDYLNRAIAQSESLLARPIGPSYREAKGSALIDLSEALVLAGLPGEARDKADEAVALLAPIARDGASPPASRDRWLLSLALTDRAAAERESGDEAAADRDLDDAEAVARRVPPDDPFYGDVQFHLARIDRQRVGPIDRAAPPPVAGEEALGRALQRLTDLIAGNRLIPEYEEEMASALSARAAVRLARRRPADAQADCREAIARIQHLIADRERQPAPEHPGYLSLLGQAERLAGRIEAAQGRAPEARRLRDAAIGHLRRAVEIDGARRQDARILERVRAEAEADRDPGAEARPPAGRGPH